MTGKPSYVDLQEIVENLIIPFYDIQRDMVIPSKSRRNETDAEHSWSLAFLGCTIAPQIDPNLDVGLIAQLAIVHDILEIYAGDVSVWDNSDKLSVKAANEEVAIKTIIKKYKHLPWLIKTIKAYEHRDTGEAKFVFALDKLIALMFRHIDHGQAYIDKKLTREAFLKGLAPNRVKAQTHPAIGEYFEELWSIFENHPEYFYQPRTQQ